MTRYEPTDLFAADAVGMNACTLVIAAVNAGEQGRYSDQRALVEKATEGFANALRKLNPAALSAPVGRG